MIKIDEALVDGLAPNANAIKNGRDLVRKGKLVGLSQTADGSLIFGECKGSGKSNYACSVDFGNAENPVSRCSCPSRQFPCKHSLGLLYAYVGGQSFATAEPPADLAEKRARAEERATKKKVASKKPKRVNKAALKKKIQAQLDGLDLLERLSHDLARAGLGNLGPKAAAELTDQAKQLGNAFLPGAQAALNALALLFRGDGDGGGNRGGGDVGAETTYTEALDQLTRLGALVKQGRAYLKSRLDDPGLKPDTTSGIAAWLGQAWQLGELRDAGCVQSSAELLQLAFYSHDDRARQEHVDTGVWVNLATGAVQLTLNYRPYRAAKFIREDDSVFHVVSAPELFVYPGDLNPRVRWESSTPRDPSPADRAALARFAQPDFAAAIKAVRGQLQSPLASRHPVLLVPFARAGRAWGHDVLEDAGGTRLQLTDRGAPGEPPSCHLLPALPAAARRGQVALLRFHHDLSDHTLRAKPLAIATPGEVFRLTF